VTTSAFDIFNSPHVVVITLGESGDFELIDETVLDVVGVKGTVGCHVHDSEVLVLAKLALTLNTPVVIAITLLVLLEASDFVLIPNVS